MVEFSESSGAVFPIMAQGKSFWVALNFLSPVSAFWSQRHCPPAVTCLSSESGSVEVGLYGVAGVRRVAFGELRVTGVDINTDVAGDLGLAPASPFVASRKLTFRRRSTEVTLEISDPAPDTAANKQFPVRQRNGLWEIQGSLFLRGWWKWLRGNAEPVVFNFGTHDVILPLSWMPKFTRADGVEGFRGHIDERNRLYRSCSQVGSETFKLIVESEHRRFKVPVVFVGGREAAMGHRRMCPVSVRFKAVPAIVLGWSVLRRYDVWLDAKNGLVGLDRPDALVAKGAAPSTRFPRYTYLDAFRCVTTDSMIRCIGTASANQETAPYQVLLVDDSVVQLGTRLETGTDLVSLPRLAYSKFEISKNRDGSLMLWARRVADGRFDLVVRRTIRGISIEFRESTRL